VSNQYLNEMGIDVWVVRDRSPSRQQDSVPVEVGDPEFHLCFLNYRSFGVCLSLGTDQDVIAPGAKRFIADVALSIGGSALKPTMNNLKWPMSERHSDARPDRTAGEVVSDRVGSLPALVLVFGRDTAGVIPGLSADESSAVSLGGRKILTLDSIDELCQGVSGKRNLWRTLNGLRGSA
jgi:hypothetical protein